MTNWLFGPALFTLVVLACIGAGTVVEWLCDALERRTTQPPLFPESDIPRELQNVYWDRKRRAALEAIMASTRRES